VVAITIHRPCRPFDLDYPVPLMMMTMIDEEEEGANSMIMMRLRAVKEDDASEQGELPPGLERVGRMVETGHATCHAAAEENGIVPQQPLSSPRHSSCLARHGVG
jgi:hypothetical protein